MSLVNVNAIEPSTGTDITLGASGDTLTVPSGATLTVSGTMNASSITAGTMATARLGSGTASSTTVLYGDQTYKTEPTGGKILQAVSTNYTSLTTNTSTSFNTSMAVTITPASTSNDILVIFTTQLSKDSGTGDSNVRIYRVVSASIAATRTITDMYFRNAVGTCSTCAGQWLDSPSTTSAITYQFAFNSTDGAQDIHINNYNASADNVGSQITAMEIAG